MKHRVFGNRILWIPLFYFPLVAISQINVVHIDPSATPQTQQGIFYALPRTVVNIEVTIDRIENYKGPYAEYAQRYLGLQNVVTANTVEYRLEKFSISTSAEPDPDQYYFVELSGILSKTENDGLLSLSESGLILGTYPAERDTFQTVYREMERQQEEIISERDVFPEIFKNYADISVFEKVDTIIRKVSIDTMTLEKQYLKRTMVEKTAEQKAKEAADFISRIKDSRFNLLIGYQEVSYNQETLEYMDAQLKLLEKEYMKLFTGISMHKVYTVHFKYIPLPNQINTEVPIFKFLPSRGIMDLDETGGRAVTIRVQRVGNTNQVASCLNRAMKESKVRGFSYRIPELARVTVKQGNEIVDETQCLIIQLGIVAYLPLDQWKVRFHQATGSIREVVID